MKIRIVSTRDDIKDLLPSEKNIHLAFRPSNEDLFKLLEACPKVEMIQLPESYYRSISKCTEYLLKMQRVTLQVGNVWGFRTDQSPYYETPSEVERPSLQVP